MVGSALSLEDIISQHSTFLEALVETIERNKDRPAATFLETGTGEGETWTYRDLDREARRVAAQLRATIEPGAPVVLMAPPGLEYLAGFFGCMYAGAIAVPAYPPSPMHGRDHMNRLHAVADSAGATVGLTTASVLSTVESFAVSNGPLTWVTIGDTTGDVDLEAPIASVSPDDVAFLQYTSGSTGDPKGVVIRQSNLIANCLMVRDTYDLQVGEYFVSWLPPYHDMGLIALVAPIVTGVQSVSMPPAVFLRRPIRWLQAISKYGGYTTAPNFAYDTCSEKIKESELVDLDLSRLRVAINGAEPVRAATLERFVDRFAPHGFQRAAFRPSYGLAETTVLSAAARSGPTIYDVDSAAMTGGLLRRAGDGVESHRMVSSGTPPTGVTLRVVDPATRAPLADGSIGEIEISGPHVAKGYWRRPDVTAERFSGDTVRTGDLGTIFEGEIVVTGRIKDVIIVRGRNYYPQDIELTVEESNPNFRRNCSAAFTVERDEQEELVVVQEVNVALVGAPEPVLDQIRRAITAAHGISPAAVVLTRPGKVPKTSSGKIRRSETKRRYEVGELESILTWHAGEELTAATH